LQTKVQDVAELAHVLEIAGVSLGGAGGFENVLKLQLSIQRLVRSQAALEAARPKVAGQGILTLASARFWGIIRGTRRDYYIVEAVRHKYPLPPNQGRSRILNAKEIADQKARKKAARQALREQKAALQAAADARAAASGGEEEAEEVVTPRPPVGVLKEKRIKPIYEKSEPSGTGANEHIYFVCNSIEARPTPGAPASPVSTSDNDNAAAAAASPSLSSPVASDPGNQWTLLPDLDPLLVASSKPLRRLFTGNLSAPVLGFPRFDGLEAAFLRTTIARISASTLVSPAGFHTTEEGADGRERVVEDREYEAPASAEDLVQAGGWVHHRAHLLRAGRNTVWEEPEKTDEELAAEEAEAEEIGEEEEEEEEEEQPPADEEEEPDEPLPLLSSVEEDQSKAVKGSLWSFRAYPKPTHPHACVLARSLLWPGAVAVAKKQVAVSLYIGDGQKACPLGFTPARPPPIAAEFEPVFNVEEDEPNPLQEQADPLPPAAGDEDGEDDEEEQSGDEDGQDDQDDDEGGADSEDQDD
jgi:radial spoke head protein 4A